MAQKYLVWLQENTLRILRLFSRSMTSDLQKDIQEPEN